MIVCARVGGANTYRFCASPFLREFCMARLRFVFESRPSFFLKGSRPSPLPPIPFFKSPPAKNQNGEERQGERAGRAVLRAWRDSASPRNRSVPGGFKPPRTRCVRSGFAQSVELDHHNRNCVVFALVFFASHPRKPRRIESCLRTGKDILTSARFFTNTSSPPRPPRIRAGAGGAAKRSAAPVFVKIRSVHPCRCYEDIVVV